ncbi:MAG: hypothetical protein KGH53_00115 [Candidatus Micrarchaeota archaeon]|nr:hypothetical protein [Candidatus Micrarchaeota archaeon]
MELIRSEADLYRILFFLSSFIFVSLATAITVFGLVSGYVQITALFAELAYFIIAFLYINNSGKKFGKTGTGVFIKGGFLLLLISIISTVSLNIEARATAAAYLLSALQYVAINVVLFLPLIFLAFFGLFLLRKGYKKVAGALFVLAFAVMLFYFFSGMVFHHYKIDDEVFIQYASSKLLLQGINPYTISVSGQILDNSTNGTISSPSITTDNKIMGTLAYPALFLLSFVPFTLIGPSTFANLVGYQLEAQGILFLLIAIFTTAIVLKKEYLEKPKYSIILFLTISLAYLSSITIYLMFALLLLAYAKLETKYSWLFLGLCASIHEQLWFPVLLLIVYSANNQGMRKGVENLVGSFGVFLVINAYFIAGNPAAFFGNIFGPVSGFLLPESGSPIGYLIATNYHILLSTYSLLFILSMIALTLLFIYLNKKKLVGLFSMIPFVFLSHSIPIYYTFFTGFMIVTLFIKEGKGVGLLSKTLSENRNVVYGALAIIVLAGVYILHASHSAYAKNFNLGVNNETLYFDSLTNTTIYSANLHYSNLTNNTIYVISGAVSRYNIGFVGILNYSIIQNCSRCSSYMCKVNVNRIVLPSNRSIYSIRLYIKPSVKDPIYGARMAIYNGNYYYVSRGIFNQTILSQFSPG